MAQDAREQKNSDASGATEPRGGGATDGVASGNGGSRVGRGVKAALVAAAVGTAVAAAARSRGSSAEPETSDTATGPRAPEGRTARARGAVRRSEPLLTAVWNASSRSLEPVLKNGARQAGRFVAELSPDFVHENVIPPFVEGLTEARPD